MISGGASVSQDVVTAIRGKLDSRDSSFFEKDVLLAFLKENTAIDFSDVFSVRDLMNSLSIEGTSVTTLEEFAEALCSHYESLLVNTLSLYNPVLTAKTFLSRYTDVTGTFFPVLPSDLDDGGVQTYVRSLVKKYTGRTGALMSGESYERAFSVVAGAHDQALVHLSRLMLSLKEEVGDQVRKETIEGHLATFRAMIDAQIDGIDSGDLTVNEAIVGYISILETIHQARDLLPLFMEYQGQKDASLEEKELYMQFHLLGSDNPLVLIAMLSYYRNKAKKSTVWQVYQDRATTDDVENYAVYEVVFRQRLASLDLEDFDTWLDSCEFLLSSLPNTSVENIGFIADVSPLFSSVFHVIVSTLVSAMGDISPNLANYILDDESYEYEGPRDYRASDTTGAASYLYLLEQMSSHPKETLNKCELGDGIDERLLMLLDFQRETGLGYDKSIEIIVQRIVFEDTSEGDDLADFDVSHDSLLRELSGPLGQGSEVFKGKAIAQKIARFMELRFDQIRSSVNALGTGGVVSDDSTTVPDEDLFD